MLQISNLFPILVLQTVLYKLTQVTWSMPRYQHLYNYFFFFWNRDFLGKYYVGLKKENPKFPFLVRECSGIQPKIYARHGMCYV